MIWEYSSCFYTNYHLLAFVLILTETGLHLQILTGSNKHMSWKLKQGMLTTIVAMDSADTQAVSLVATGLMIPLWH
jgi:hypothetical protein